MANDSKLNMDSELLPVQSGAIRFDSRKGEKLNNSQAPGLPAAGLSVA